jgi:hypothetical protein
MTPLPTFRFVKEPRGNSYKRLLEFAIGRADNGTLVIRHEMTLSDSGHAFLREIGPHTIQTRLAREWPGTATRSAHRLVEFRYDAETAEILSRAVEGLYGWRQPDRPEDLVLRREDEPWLVTISHESEGWLICSEEEGAQIGELGIALRES